MLLGSFKTVTGCFLLSICAWALLLATPSSSNVAAIESLPFKAILDRGNRPSTLWLSQGTNGEELFAKLKHSFADKEFGTFNGFDPTGREFATISQGSVRIWDTESGKQRLIFGGYKEITTAHFVQDGRTIVTTGRMESSKLFTTKLWDAQSGTLRVSLDGFILLGPGAYGGNESTAITITDRELKFWNAKTGELEKTVTGYTELHSDWRFFLDSLISSDGELVVRYQGKKALLWETGTGKLRADLSPPRDDHLSQEYRGRQLELVQARFSPDGRTLATVDSYNRVELWDSAGKLRATLIGHLDSIYNLEFSGDGRFLATASRDGTARVWDVAAGKPKDTLKAGNQIARRVEFSPDGTILAVGYQNRARLWNVNSGRLIAELPEDKDVSRATFFGTYLHGIELRFSPDGKLLLAMSDKTVSAWDATTGKFISTLEGARPPVAFSSNGRLLATSGGNKSVLLWELSSP